MLKNMKIKMSLILGFSVTILVSIAIVVTSLIVMNVQTSSYERIINTNMRASALVRTCRLNVNMAARSLRDVALSPESASAKTAIDAVNDCRSSHYIFIIMNAQQVQLAYADHPAHTAFICQMYRIVHKKQPALQLPCTAEIYDVYRQSCAKFAQYVILII